MKKNLLIIPEFHKNAAFIRRRLLFATSKNLCSSYSKAVFNRRRLLNEKKRYLLYGNVVMMPYSCINASSTIRSSLRLVGVGSLCAYTGSLCFGVSLILNSVFMPISRRSRANLFWYLTRRSSIC